MERYKWAIRVFAAALVLAAILLVLDARLGWGLIINGTDEKDPPRSVEEGAPSPEGLEETSRRQVFLPEIYLNGPAGSQRIESGSTRVLSGNINLTFRFTEPVDIEKENGFVVQSSRPGKMDRFNIGYANAERTTVWMNIPPEEIEEENLQILINRSVLLDGEAALREPVMLYMTRYAPNKADIRQTIGGRPDAEPEFWLTEGSKVFNLQFEREVNPMSVERTLRRNAAIGEGTPDPSMSFDWKNDLEVRVTFNELTEGSYAIDLTGAEDRIGLKMEGASGSCNYWAFDVGKKQRLKTYDIASGAIETLQSGIFEERRYLSGRIDGDNLILHRHGAPDSESGTLLFDKLLLEEATGTLRELEKGGDLSNRYAHLLEDNRTFRGIRLSPDGSLAAAFASPNEIGLRGRTPVLMLIDTATDALVRTMDMPFFILSGGDGIFPMDLHFTWIDDTVIFTEGFTEFGNTAHIYGINLDTGAVVALKENVREPSYVEGLDFVTAVKMVKTGDGTVQKDGEEPREISYYEDSEIILMGAYGNVLKNYSLIGGYSPFEHAGESLVYDAPASKIWSWENKILYPEKTEASSRLVLQDLGAGEMEFVDIGMNFILLGVKDGKAYLLEETGKE